MNNPKLSYILTTKNKLPYLKNRIEVLLSERKSDEEILVADGASTDGTREYLEQLKKSGKIDYFVSEPDHGESHALNKLILVAKGEIIKGITDDDVFFFDTLQKCKDFMITHPEVDILGSEGGSLNKNLPISGDSNPKNLVRAIDYENYYRVWKEKRIPFSFCGLGMMWRRSSIPVIGFFDLSFYSADAEFSFRNTASKANIAWYTGYSFVNVKNPQSVTWVHKKKVGTEIERLKEFYLGEKNKIKFIKQMRSYAGKMKLIFLKNKENKKVFDATWPKMFEIAHIWLEQKNKEKKPEFILSK